MGKDMPGHAHVHRHSAVSCAKMSEPIDLPFGLWTRVGRMKHKFNRIRQWWRQCALVGGTLAQPGEYAAVAFLRFWRRDTSVKTA